MQFVKVMIDCDCVLGNATYGLEFLALPWQEMANESPHEIVDVENVKELA